MMRVLSYEIPDELHYSKEHEWVRIEGEEGVVGITDYAQKQLHEIVYVEIHKVGTNIEQYQTMGTVESVKSVSDVFSPVTGKITRVNEELAETPELLNQNSYGRGWLARVHLTDIKHDLEKLMTAQQYADFIKEMEE